MYQVYAILLKTENPIIVEKYILFNFNKTSHKKCILLLTLIKNIFMPFLLVYTLLLLFRIK